MLLLSTFLLMGVLSRVEREVVKIGWLPSYIDLNRGWMYYGCGEENKRSI